MAKRSGFDGVFLDGTTGLPLIGLDIAVYNSSGSTLSTIYTTKEGDTIKTNPFQTTSGNSGLVQFWAAPGYYEIEVSDSLSRISTRRIPFDAVAGDTTSGSEGISLSQFPIIGTSKIEDDAITSAKLKDSDSVDSDRAVTTNHIKDNAITNSKIDSNAISTSKIENDAVTPAKLSPVVFQDSSHSEIFYNGTGTTQIINLTRTVTTGTWLILASLNVEVNNGLLNKAFLRTVDDPAEITTMFFEGEGRSGYSIPVTLIAIATFTAAETIGVWIGSGGGGEVDIKVPFSQSTLRVMQLG